jgi:hypothetical protein
VSSIGINRCQCDLGFFGTYCDFKGNELPSLKGIAQDIIDKTLSIMAVK